MINQKKTEMQDIVIQKIKALRLKHGISQSSLGVILNISNGQIGNIESPKYQHKYTLRQIYMFCKHIGYPLERIFLSEEESTCQDVCELLIKRLIEYEG